MITIENKPESGVVLVEHVGKGDGVLVPFAFPSQRIPLEGKSGYRFFTRVPLDEDTSSLLPVATEQAREAIPFREALGKGFETYIVGLKGEGGGGTVNSVSIEAPNIMEDTGIIFIAS